MQFHNQSDALYHWNVDKNRELANVTQISDVAAGPWAPKPDQAKAKRSLSMKRSAAMSSHLVVSKDAQHSFAASTLWVEIYKVLNTRE